MVQTCSRWHQLKLREPLMRPMLRLDEFWNRWKTNSLWCSNLFFSSIVFASRIVADLWWISDCVIIFLFVVLYQNSCAFIATEGYAYPFVFVDYFFNGCRYCFVGFAFTLMHVLFLIRSYTGSYQTVTFNLNFFIHVAFIFLPAYGLLLLVLL